METQESIWRKAAARFGLPRTRNSLDKKIAQGVCWRNHLFVVFKVHGWEYQKARLSHKQFAAVEGTWFIAAAVPE